MPIWFKAVSGVLAVFIFLTSSSLFLIHTQVLGFGCGAFINTSPRCPTSGFECVSPSLPDDGEICYPSHLAHIIYNINLFLGEISLLGLIFTLPPYLLTILFWLIFNIWGRIFRYKTLISIKNLGKVYLVLIIIWILLSLYGLSQVIHLPPF